MPRSPRTRKSLLSYLVLVERVLFKLKYLSCALPQPIIQEVLPISCEASVYDLSFLMSDWVPLPCVGL